VEPTWRFCPHCNAPLRARRRRRADRPVDAEVGRDSAVSVIVLGALGILILLGATAFVSGWGLRFVEQAPSGGKAVFAFGGLGLVVVAVGVGVLVWRSRGPGIKVLWGVVGGVMLTGLVVLVFILAVVVSVLQACSEGCGPRPAGPQPRWH
jgi:hypothetical protein